MENVKCIKGFLLEKCDNDGFSIENSYMNVKEGSIWEIEKDNFRVVGGEIRLINDGLEWLEISKETLETNFEYIEGN